MLEGCVSTDWMTPPWGYASCIIKIGADRDLSAYFTDCVDESWIMTTFLIIIAIVAVAYIFAAVTFHYGFKNWYPMCGCKSLTCRREK